MGYYFGTFDQSSHIPFLKKYADPSLFPGDAFFDLRFTHYSYFWFFFLPFYRLGLLEPSMFVVYVLTIYATFWALWRLSQTLFDNPLSSLLSIIAFTLPHIGFAGFSVIEFSLLNRTFVLPFLLLALDLYLQRRYLLTFLLLGLLYNLHVISVNFVLFMVLFDALVQRNRVGWRAIVQGMIVFVIAASPVLIWKLGGSPVDFSPRWQWFSIISRGMLEILFYMLAPYPQILIVTLGGVSAIVLFFIARRHAPAPQHDRSITNFIYATLIILAVEIVTAQWYPATIIIQSQIIRAGLFVVIFGYLYFANYLAKGYQSGRVARPDFTLLTSALACSICPVVLLIAWAGQRWISAARLRRMAVALLVLVTFVGMSAELYATNLWRPGIHIFAQRSPWYDAQVWARDHTPRDALFITPPQIWWFYDLEWRVISERSTVVTLSELLEAAFSPEYMDHWKPRFEALAPGALDQFQGDIFANIGTTAHAFYSLSTGDLRRVARTYGASYLVVEKPHRYAFPVVYENEEFIIYRLTNSPEP